MLERPRRLRRIEPQVLAAGGGDDLRRDLGRKIEPGVRLRRRWCALERKASERVGRGEIYVQPRERREQLQRMDAAAAVQHVSFGAAHRCTIRKSPGAKVRIFR